LSYQRKEFEFSAHVGFLMEKNVTVGVFGSHCYLTSVPQSFIRLRPYVIVESKSVVTVIYE